MEILDFVKRLESKTDSQRFEIITDILKEWNIDFFIQNYSQNHQNIIVQNNPNQRNIALGSHFDVVQFSGGANDNASAIAICLYILQKHKNNPSFKNISLTFFFFDEEETGLKGSKAYLKEFGLGKIESFINFELVGQGDKFGLWSLNANTKGLALESFENICQKNQISSFRFDKIVTNTADHVRFREVGLEDAFTITCLSDADMQIYIEYQKAQVNNAPLHILQSIIQKAPLFQHYHQPSDLSIYLSEKTLQMTANIVWQTLELIDTINSGIL